MENCYNLECTIKKKIYKVIYFSVTKAFSNIAYTKLLGEIDSLKFQLNSKDNQSDIQIIIQQIKEKNESLLPFNSENKIRIGD